MTKTITCFKAYDIRGKLIEQLDENIAFRIGKALVETLAAKTIVVGSDVRLTSAPLKLALAAGAIDAGATVTDIGMVGTEEIYFATKDLGVEAGVEVTASHNPIDYNGMKIVKAGSVPISGDTGLHEIQRLAESYDDAEIHAKLAQYAAADYAVASEREFLTGIALVTESALIATGQYVQQDLEIVV